MKGLRFGWTIAAMLLMTCCGTLASAAQAKQATTVSAWRPSGVFVQMGAAPHAFETTAGAVWDLPWQVDTGWGTASAYFEATLGRWSNDGDGSDNIWFTQLGLTPVLRVHPRAWGDGWFAEAGIGANVIAPLYHNGHKHFSTALNFGDHLAVGRQFGAHDEHELAVRFEHFSNARIREPNPGENFVQLRYLRRF